MESDMIDRQINVIHSLQLCVPPITPEYLTVFYVKVDTDRFWGDVQEE